LQIEQFVATLATLLLLSSVSFHLTNIGFPFQSGESSLNNILKRSFTERDYDIHFIRIVNPPDFLRVEQNKNAPYSQVKNSWYPWSQLSDDTVVMTSSILDKEMQGYNIISTTDNQDIYNALHALNQSLTHSVNITTIAK
jgi:hypothetical protein